MPSKSHGKSQLRYLVAQKRREIRISPIVAFAMAGNNPRFCYDFEQNPVIQLDCATERLSPLIRIY